MYIGKVYWYPKPWVTISKFSVQVQKVSQAVPPIPPPHPVALLLLLFCFVFFSGHFLTVKIYVKVSLHCPQIWLKYVGREGGLGYCISALSEEFSHWFLLFLPFFLWSVISHSYSNKIYDKWTIFKPTTFELSKLRIHLLSRNPSHL